jgi:hypothetical protein
VKAVDARGLPLVDPDLERVGIADAQPAEIENLERAAAPRSQSCHALQDVDVVIERRADENADVDVGLTRRLPVVEAMHQRFEALERQLAALAGLGDEAIAADVRARHVTQRERQTSPTISLGMTGLVALFPNGHSTVRWRRAGAA